MVTRAQDDPFLTLNDLADRWGFSRLTIHRYITEGGLPSYKVGQGPNGARRIRLSEAEAWLADRREVRSA